MRSTGISDGTFFRQYRDFEFILQQKKPEIAKNQENC